MTNKALYNLAKATLSTLYFNCVTGLNEIAKECWKIYNTKREDDLTVTNWHRIAALRMAIDINDKKFSMFTHAPAMMQIGRLHDEVATLKNNILEGKDPIGFRRLPYREEELDK